VSAQSGDEISRSIDPSRLIFIGETWTETNMTPLFGWAPLGERLAGEVPHGHWQTMTLVAAIRHDRVDEDCQEFCAGGRLIIEP
jgi:hypothetical protein